MEQVDVNLFSAAIRDTYPGMTDDAAKGYAELWLSRIVPQLHGALNCWIERRPIDDVSVGEYSIKRILSIRADKDYLQAILLLSEYMKNPERGEALIFAPRK